jgi:tetratricopeptide (TPR) repeat protein
MAIITEAEEPEREREEKKEQQGDRSPRDLCNGFAHLKFIQTAGVGKEKVCEGDSVVLEVKEKFLDDDEDDDDDDDVEDNNINRQWFEHKYVVGDGSHPEALDEALKMMQEGDLAKLKISKGSEYQLSDLMKIDQQYCSKTALFTIKVVKITDKGKIDKFTLRHEERMDYGEAMLNIGKSLWETKRYRRAQLRWENGADIFSLREPQGEFDKNGERKNNEAKVIAEKLYNNLAMVHLRKEDYEQAEEFATEALDCNRKNIKALMRRAAARLNLIKWDEAEKDMDNAIEFESDEKKERLKRELIPLRKKLAGLRKEQDGKDRRGGFQNMFKNDGKTTNSSLYSKEEMAKEFEAFPCTKSKNEPPTVLDWDAELRKIDAEEAKALQMKGMKEREFKYNVLRAAHDPEMSWTKESNNN